MAELLTDQLRTMAEAFPDVVAASNVTTNESMTFQEWETRSNQLARWLTAQGVEKGDRVAILIPPEAPFDFLVAYSATHKAGAIAVPLNTRLVERELDALLDHSGSKVVLRAGELVFEGDDSAYQVPLDSTRHRRRHVHVGYDRATEGRRRAPRQHRHGAQRQARESHAAGLAARVADVHLRRHRVDLQPDEARDGVAVHAALRRRRVVRRRRAAPPHAPPSSSRRWPNC